MLARVLSLLVFLTGVAAADPFWQKLHWMTSDGISMVGNYHPPKRAGAPLWVLLHGLGSTKEEWSTFAQALGNEGYGILIYDARGHGESTQTRAGQKVSYQEWKNAGPGTPWDAMVGDLGQAIEALRQQAGSSKRRISVGGASLGANVALRYASLHQDIESIVLLSPGFEYAGIQSPGNYKAYRGRPVFLAASAEDSYSHATVRQLSQLAPSPAQTVAEAKRGHGVQMIDAAFTKQMLDWMKTTHGNRNRRTP